jgi:voltage-gated potassium channel Kch
MAVGMSTNVAVLIEMPMQVIAGVLLLLIVKLALLTLLGGVFKLQKPEALRFAAYLCQGGEFGFVAFTLAASMGILGNDEKDLLILVVTLSMALTPAVLMLARRVVPPSQLSESELVSLLPPAEAQDLIIAGFGRFGQILGRVLNARGIHFTAIDKNPEQVQLVRRFGNMVYFGDVARHSLLDKAHASQARVLALCIDDIEASITAVELAKKHYPQLRIFARARNRFHEARLRELGVDYVIRETLLSALDFTRVVLQGLGVGEAEAQYAVHTFRVQDNKLLAQQAALMGDVDESSYIQSSQQAAEELRNLLSQDTPKTPAETS